MVFLWLPLLFFFRPGEAHKNPQGAPLAAGLPPPPEDALPAGPPAEMGES
jgi:hypothetical protein